MLNEKYKLMVYKYVNQVQRKHHGLLSVVDLEAAAQRGICEAERTYNPKSTASIKTWIYIHARRYIQDEVRQQRKAMSENVSATAQHDGEVAQCNVVDTLGFDSDVEDRINREQLHDLLLRQIRKLPAKQQRIMIKMLATGMSQTELARQEGCTKALISQQCKKAVAKLRLMMLPLREEILGVL